MHVNVFLHVSQPMFVSKNSVVDYKPVDNSRCVGFREATPAHTMYIMADLSADGKYVTYKVCLFFACD